jgi:hypothetical protein
VHHYTYYSYEEFGRGYIGSRSSKLPPEEDPYMGSFTDKSFKPATKIILSFHGTRQDAYEAEVILHDFFSVDENPAFVNMVKASTTVCNTQGMVRINNGERESLAYPDQIPKGWVTGRLKNPNEYIVWDKERRLHDKRGGSQFERFLKDVAENPSLIHVPIRTLARTYGTSHTSIVRWKKWI